MVVGTSVSTSSVASANGRAAASTADQVARNPGLPLDLDWVHEARFTNRSAAERRAATLPTRRSVKKAWQAAWLLRAVTCMDLTTLQGDDTPGNVRRLCAKARQPVRHDVLDALGVGDLAHHGGRRVRLPQPGRDGRRGAGRARAFRSPRSRRVSRRPDAVRDQAGEIRASVAAGANEIDIVISRAHVLTRRLRGAVRRGARLSRSLRRRAHEDDHRHRRARHAAQRARARAWCA